MYSCSDVGVILCVSILGMCLMMLRSTGLIMTPIKMATSPGRSTRRVLTEWWMVCDLFLVVCGGIRLLLLSVDMNEIHDHHRNLTFSQVLTRDQNRFNLADKNGDKSLSKEEFADFLHPRE